MKQLKNLKFREDVKILSVEQMKALKGGGSYCHCMNESGSHEASSCDECNSICSGVCRIVILIRRQKRFEK